MRKNLNLTRILNEVDREQKLRTELMTHEVWYLMQKKSIDFPEDIGYNTLYKIKLRVEKEIALQLR